MTQKERLIKYFKQHGRINPLQALEALGIYRLSAVVLKLRKDGFDIQTINTPVHNRFGEQCNVATYVFHDHSAGFGFRSASAILEALRGATSDLKEANDRYEEK